MATTAVPCTTAVLVAVKLWRRLVDGRSVKALCGNAHHCQNPAKQLTILPRFVGGDDSTAVMSNPKLDWLDY